MDDTGNLELPGPDNDVWRDNGAASYSRFYTGFQHSVQHFVMDTLFLSNCRSSNDANCRQIIRHLWQEKDIAHSHGSILYRHSSRRIRKQHRIHACSKSCTGHWDVYVPNSLWNHQRNPSREKTCNRSDYFQFDIFWRGCSGVDSWCNHNSKLWVASHILFNISYSSHTWLGDQEAYPRQESGNLGGESGGGRKK